MILGGLGMPGRFRGPLATAVAVVAGLLVPALTAGAVDQGTLTLDARHGTVAWHGTGVNPAQGYGPPVCVAQAPVNCDVVHLDVALPAGTFGPGDGVLVSIKWATDFDQYNLFVDNPDGTPAASGIDVDSNGQSVLLAQPQNGVYTIRVVPFYVTFPQDRVYNGTAQVWHDPTTGLKTGTKLLPQLRTMPPSNFHIGDVPPLQSNPTGWRWTPDGTFSNSCYLDETVDYGSTRCLRFDNDIRNVGIGALKLRFRWDTNVLQNCQMQQEIDVIGGSPIDQNAGPCVFHKQHAHFHYQNFAWYQLFAVAADGQPSNLPVSRSKKLGFCTVDVDDYAFGGPASTQRARKYSFPTCNVPNNINTTDPAMWEYMGISPGWGDIYTWDLPAQYLDVSNVADGTYELVSRANPDGRIAEATTGLETGITCIHIKGNTVTPLQVFPSQSNSAPLPPCTTPRTRATSLQPVSTSPSSGLSPLGNPAASIVELPNTGAAAGSVATVPGLLGASVAGLVVAARRRRRHGAAS
jgi:LPXTG-motif cell wall-anchored protein